MYELYSANNLDKKKNTWSIYNWYAIIICFRHYEDFEKRIPREEMEKLEVTALLLKCIFFYFTQFIMIYLQVKANTGVQGTSCMSGPPHQLRGYYDLRERISLSLLL